eukprot:scaffold6881_cov126-Cylindrotheca_fusiformis.AAC.2
MESRFRPKGWTPLKYPKSALNSDRDSFVYFPLHPDVLSACVRELLILDGTLDSGSLNASKTESLFIQDDGKQVSVPRFLKHLDLESWPRSAEVDEASMEKCRKRKKVQTGHAKKLRSDGGVLCSHTSPCAEDIAKAIIRRGRLGLDSSDENRIRPPTMVAEADCDPASEYPSEIVEADRKHSQEIATVLDLQKRTANGTFCRIKPATTLVRTSISNEAFLRDVSRSMTQRIVESFADKALRLFMGYKAPNIRRFRLVQLLAGFLFDTSHAMFAWDQTEQDILALDPAPESLDSTVQKCLFDDRALKKIGGFEHSSLLPNAISIGRLRRRDSTWESFATTVQGKRMFQHHGQDESIIAAGKLRRGQRLRQRHWLTSSLLLQDSDLDGTDGDGPPRARSCSFGSSEGEEDAMGGNSAESQGQNRMTVHIPGTKTVSLAKSSPNESWGVCLGKEGNACVVGRAQDNFNGSDRNDYLRCGDLILHGQNENGKEVFSPLCSWNSGKSKTDNWFGDMVDLFKQSQQLQLVVQRVN